MFWTVQHYGFLRASQVSYTYRQVCQCRRQERCRFDPWFKKIPWNRKWQPTPVFLPGKLYGQRSLVGYSLWGRRESDKTGYACARTHTQLLRDEVRRGDRMQIKERLRGLHKESGVYPIANEKLRNVGINVLCIRQAIPVGIYRWTRKRAKIGGRMPWRKLM